MTNYVFIGHIADRTEPANIPVYLDGDGSLIVGQWTFPDDRDRTWRRLYIFCFHYLKARNEPFDISRAREPHLTTVLNWMDAHDRFTLTRDELVDFVFYRHELALIQNEALKRARRLVRRRLPR